jgi:hypothetical protein
MLVVRFALFQSLIISALPAFTTRRNIPCAKTNLLISEALEDESGGNEPVGQLLPLSQSPLGGFHSQESSQQELDRSCHHCPFLHLFLPFWPHFLLPPSHPKPFVNPKLSCFAIPVKLTFTAIAVRDLFRW